MNLSGQQRKRLRDALIEAFPTYSLLEQLLDLELDKKLNKIAQDSNLQTVVYQLIQRAQAEGWLIDLVWAARKENPLNLQLEAIAQELLPSKTPFISSNTRSSATVAGASTQQQKILILVFVIILIALTGVGFTIITAQINKNPPNEASTEITPKNESISLVGVWQTNVIELGQSLRITWQLKADGTSQFEILSNNGVFSRSLGKWQYSDGIISENYTNGSFGKGSIKWINDNNFELTILDNGIPSLTGTKRYYRRVAF